MRSAGSTVAAFVFGTLTLLSFSEGYVIDTTCYAIGHDLVKSIAAGMREALYMAQLGEFYATRPNDRSDNTRSRLFTDADEVHLEQLRGIVAQRKHV
jgi:predicted hydrocarbon binding protein